MKFEYNIEKKCDGCSIIKNTREVKNLDPLRKKVINFLCKFCDHSHHTIPKILKWNKKNLKETHSIFGFELEKILEFKS